MGLSEGSATWLIFPVTRPKIEVRGREAPAVRCARTCRASVETQNQSPHEEVPAINHHEQQDLEGKRDKNRWQHHHAH